MFDVRALWDIDTTPDIAELTVTAIGGDYNFTHTVPVTISEDPSNEAVITTRAITVPEGGTETYQVVLNSAPTGDVVVTPASSDSNLSFDPPSLTFTTGNWTTQQSFMVTAPNDGIRADRMSTITHTSTGYSGAHHDEVSVTITNSSRPGIVFSTSEPARTVTEGATSTNVGRYNLTAQPFDGMDVTLTFADATNRIVFTPESMTFTMDDWNTPKDLDVSGVEDTNRTDETVTVTVTVSSLDTTYANLSPYAPITITITDNDIPGVVFAPPTLTVTEGATSTNVGAMTLAAQPFMDVTVAFNHDGGKIEFFPPRITFTMGDWDTPQDLAVRGLEDNDPLNEVVEVTVTTMSDDSGYDGLTVPTFDVNVTDDDTREVIISASALTVTEGHATESEATYTIVLGTQPTGRVTVTLFGNDGDDFTANGPRGMSRVVFTTANWAAEQQVTVTATDDRIDEDDETSNIRHTVGGGFDYDSVTAPNVSITVKDNDTAAVIVTEVSTIALEDGTSDASYTVKLDSQPTETVTITPSIGTYIGTNTGRYTDVTFSPTSLVFSATDWEDAKTVNVVAFNDFVDEDDESLTITHSAVSSDPKYSSTSSDPVTIDSVTVMITDNDTAEVIILPRQITLIEGHATESSKDYTIVLGSEPTHNVEITLASSPAYDTDRDSVLFTRSNWNMAARVRVSVVDDDIDEAEAITGLQRSSVMSSDPKYQAFGANTLSITIITRDDDTRGVTVTESVPTGLTVDEEGPTAATYTVVLTSQPTDTVTITPDIGTNTDVTFLPPFLEFLPAMWDDAQIVTVTAVDDFIDEDDESLTITHSASSSDRKYSSGETNNPVTIENVAVMIMDNDDAGFDIASSFEVAEGSTGTIAIKLTSAPSAIVAVALTTTSTDFSVPAAPMFFSTTNWNMPQNVTVTPVDDDDGADEIGGTIEFEVTSLDPKYGGFDVPDIAVTVRDDDSPSLGLFQPSLFSSLSEDGGSGNFRVNLNVQPTGGDVTVTITSNPTGVFTVNDTDGGTTGNQNTLIFSDTTWNTGQTVTITAVNDDIDNAGDEREAVITFDPSGADYESGVPSLTVTITAEDDDTRGVVVSDSEITVEEDGAAVIYTIVLLSQPTANVRITITDPDPDSIVETDVDFVMFEPGNWNTPQEVRVDSDWDEVDDDTVTETFTHMASGGDYDSETVAAIKVIVDNIDERGVMVTDVDEIPVTTMSIMEDQEQDYLFLLDSRPSGPLTINIRSSDATIATVDPISFTIDPDDWESAAFAVTVTAVNNDIDHPADQMVDIIHTIGAGTNDYAVNNVTINSLEVTVTDEEDTRGLVLPRLTVTINEGGTERLAVKLKTRPVSGTVTVTPTITGTGTYDEATFLPPNLIFNTSNWDTVQIITLSNPQDRVDEEQTTATLTLDASGSDYELLADLEVALTLNDDNDTRGVIIGQAPGSLNEGFGGGSYRISLNSQPTDDVTITITMEDSDSDSLDDAMLEETSFIFTPSNWNNPQTVRISVVDDDVDDDGESVTFHHGVMGGDYGANNVTAISRTVGIGDNDTRGVTVRPMTSALAPLSVPEFIAGQELGDNEREYTVVLDSQPTADVTITITKTGETTLSADPVSLTFTTTDWEMPQVVTVTAADDDNHASGEEAVFAHSVSGGDYTTTPALAIDSVIAATVDTDSPNVLISAGALDFDEGADDTYDITLTTDPQATVTVHIEVQDADGDNAGDITVSSASIEFTSANWNVAQTITVEAAVDADAVNETARIDHRVTNYGSALNPAPKPASIAVTVTDPNVQSVEVSKSALDIDEGESDTYTVKLLTQPVGGTDVTVTVNNPNTTDDLTVTPSILRFNATTWETAMTVEVEAVHDNIDDDGESVTLTHTVTGADYDGTSAGSVDVSIEDFDVRGVIVSETSRTFDEEKTSTYTIVLNSKPLGPVTVDVSSDKQTKVTVVSPSSSRLTFGPGNWNIHQTVTLGAPHDDDVEDETATIEHSVGGSDYGANNETADDVTVTITDNDEEGVTISPTKLRFLEGGTAFYEVVLHTQPSVGQVVRIEITDDSPLVRVNPEFLEFTRDSWDMALRVTVVSLTDGDELNNIVNIRHFVDDYWDFPEEAEPVEVDPVEATVAEFELEELAPLGAPTQLTAAARDGRITLNWRPPELNDDGRVPTSYQYRYRPTAIDDYASEHSSGTGWITINRGPSARFVQVSGLINLAEYTFQVRGVDAVLLAEADSDEDLSTLLEVQGTYIHRTRDC